MVLVSACTLINNMLLSVFNIFINQSDVHIDQVKSRFDALIRLYTQEISSFNKKNMEKKHKLRKAWHED